jgi:hypothetical protein
MKINKNQITHPDTAVVFALFIPISFLICAIYNAQRVQKLCPICTDVRYN